MSHLVTLCSNIRPHLDGEEVLKAIYHTAGLLKPKVGALFEEEIVEKCLLVVKSNHSPAHLTQPTHTHSLSLHSSKSTLRKPSNEAIGTCFNFITKRVNEIKQTALLSHSPHFTVTHAHKNIYRTCDTNKHLLWPKYSCVLNLKWLFLLKITSESLQCLKG